MRFARGAIGAFWCIFGSDFVFKFFFKPPFLYNFLKITIFYIKIHILDIHPCYGVILVKKFYKNIYD